VPLERGAVYRREIDVIYSNRGTGRALKYIVLLQDPNQVDQGATNYAYVIASTDRSGGREPRNFEARLGPVDGFHHSTMVDGRWVYTEVRADLNESDYCFTVSEERMNAIALAVFIGLQLVM
jgi:hypothetical protein